MKSSSIVLHNIGSSQSGVHLRAALFFGALFGAALLAADARTLVTLLPDAHDDAALAAAGVARADVAHLPPGAPVRIVAVGGASNVCPCGGTHVHSASQIGAIRVTKLASKKGKTKVSYALE